MALQTVESEILKIMRQGTNSLRKKMGSTFIHNITVNAIDMAPVFKDGIDDVMKKAGFDDATIQHINEKYNTKGKWQAISRNMFGAIQSLCAEPAHGLMSMSEFFRIKPAREVYMLEGSNSSTWTIRIYNSNTEHTGGTGLTKFNQALRQEAYTRFVNSLPEHRKEGMPDATDKLPRESGRGTVGVVDIMGRQAPFVHQSGAVGKIAFSQAYKELKKNQDFIGALETLKASRITVNCLDQIANSLRLSVLKETVVMPDGSEKKKILIKGNFETGNKAGSNFEDWTRIKNELMGGTRKGGASLDSLLGGQVAAGMQKIDAFRTDNPDAATEAEGSTPSKKKAISKATHKILDASKKSKITKKAKTKLKKEKSKAGKEQRAIKTKRKAGTGVKKKNIKLDLGKGKGKIKLTPQEQQENRDQLFLNKLENQINKRLPAEVRRNMGRPALINQTGRFSSSVKLENLRYTAAGISGEYTYMLSPYETFENTGVKRWPLGYNPKPLISKSIRALAMQYTEERLVSLRRT